MLYVVRHGQTEWNVEARFQGQQDSPLSVLGQQQALNAAAFLASAGIEELYASPLERAWKTAGAIAETIGRERRPEDRLKECGFGACEGMTLEEIEVAFPGKTAWRDADRWNRPYPDGESYADVVQRVRSFAEENLRPALRPDGPVICTVAHGMLNRCLVGYLCGWSREETMTAHQDNDEIFMLSDESAARVRVPGV
ncbi:histidine phosphatase family protein [Denitrobaculum tricleocarpae]|uniref:Histidine phosphatase family protein n=1 Tax=Denitrobaculum tricleocarpae TaxID=2591009 RepID=A0A545U2R2_9PROT|nr:histidine phosphatase family protein [Denitrobaculum tricleocarpae]TQV83746.1 histidine phosphatase family protein [Denitrobaculum tricleocarpae]